MYGCIETYNLGENYFIYLKCTKNILKTFIKNPPIHHMQNMKISIIQQPFADNKV